MSEEPNWDELGRELERRGQGHLLAGLDALDAARRRSFAAELAALDWDLLDELKALTGASAGGAAAALAPAPRIEVGVDPAGDAAARERGEALLREGRVAAFTVAGGQGSRLGFEGPKGLFAATPITGKSLFRVFAEKVAAVGRRYGRPLPWFLMTSEANDAETRAAFREADWFGLDPDQVHFFAQDMLPALDEEGRILLAGPGELFRSPNGHGGSLLALARSGALARMEAAGIDEIFYFQVDNPLVVVADPIFLGYHAARGAEMSTKVVPKRDWSEKVGVVGLIDGRYGVIEYSDLGEDELRARDESGGLRFSAGNIAVHALRRDFVASLTAEGLDLPYHVARKRIPAWHPAEGEVREVTGFKFETFVFDALARCENSVVLSVDRRREFAPIKNAEGEDSPASSRRAQSQLFADWLEARGVAVPRDAEGAPRHEIEISPLRALEAADLSDEDLAAIDPSGPILI
ncbi:MAG: UDPGP type 1 family protein [Planctomycetota bacterium]